MAANDADLKVLADLPEFKKMLEKITKNENFAFSI